MGRESMDNAREKLVAAMIPILELESDLVWGSQAVGQIVDRSLGSDLEVFQIEDIERLMRKLCELYGRYCVASEMNLELKESLQNAVQEMSCMKQQIQMLIVCGLGTKTAKYYLREISKVVGDL